MPSSQPRETVDYEIKYKKMSTEDDFRQSLQRIQGSAARRAFSGELFTPPVLGRPEVGPPEIGVAIGEGMPQATTAPPQSMVDIKLATMLFQAKTETDRQFVKGLITPPMDPFFTEKGIRRFFLLSSADRLITMASLILMLLSLIFALYHAMPILIGLVGVIAVSSVHAAAGEASTLSPWFDPKPIMSLIMTLGISGALACSLWAIFYSPDKERVKAADGYVKMILGFFTGSLRGSVGI